MIFKYVNQMYINMCIWCSDTSQFISSGPVTFQKSM